MSVAEDVIDLQTNVGDPCGPYAPVCVDRLCVDGNENVLWQAIAAVCYRPCFTGDATTAQETVSHKSFSYDHVEHEYGNGA